MCIRDRCNLASSSSTDRWIKSSKSPEKKASSFGGTASISISFLRYSRSTPSSLSRERTLSLTSMIDVFLLSDIYFLLDQPRGNRLSFLITDHCSLEPLDSICFLPIVRIESAAPHPHLRDCRLPGGHEYGEQQPEQELEGAERHADGQRRKDG